MEEKRTMSKTSEIIWSIAVFMVILAVAVTLLVKGEKERTAKLEQAGISTVQKLVDNAWNSNMYIQAHVSEDDFIAFLYNKNREVFAQTKSGGLAVYRKDDKFISFGDTIAMSYNISPLRLLELSLQLVKEASATIEKKESTTEEQKAKLTTYTITIDDKDNIKKLYAKIDKSYSEEAVKQMFTDKNTKGKMVITIVTGEDNSLSASCALEIDGQEYLSWYFDGYLKMYDWQLPKEWYDNDLSNKDKWIGLINKLADDIEAKSKKYALDNNIDITKPADTDSSTANEGSSTINGSIINGIDVTNLAADKTTYDKWSAMSDKDKVATVESVLQVVKGTGKQVLQPTTEFIKQIDLYYESNNKETTVSTIIIAVGMALGYIK